MEKIAVCDDDAVFRKRMADYIGRILPAASVSLFADGESLLDSGETFALIFLDVDMKGMNGIETAEKLRRKDKKVKIVYVTAYQEFARPAFSVHAFGYLLKPVTEADIAEQIREAEAYREPEEAVHRVRLETENGWEELDVKEIYYFEYSCRKIRIVTKERERLMRGSITRLAERMKSYGFCMPHKSFVVNLYYVKAIRGYDIYLMDGSVIPLSQKKSVSFREHLSRFLAERI